ncbi:hypothetical protein LJR225_001829 [Phenylobacterium sp. LjRoot225]|uniref:hypothetical protein n=1 Tax=Phenylobacterium sp. LjRoot225 TaxID=3342285 RepID=UPI003ED0336C
MARNLFDLTGRVVLAAGANSGIGLGFLRGCARQGADIAGPAAYLASDASRFHTGDILVVDGGRTVKSL